MSDQVAQNMVQVKLQSAVATAIQFGVSAKEFKSQLIELWEAELRDKAKADVREFTK